MRAKIANKVSFIGNAAMKVFYLIPLLMYAAFATDGVLAEDANFSPVTSVFTQPEFLQVDEAFVLSATINNSDILLRWEIQPGYYLYKDFLTLARAGETSTNINDAPEGKMKQDENFGEMEVYFNELIIKASTADVDNAGNSFLFDVGYRGCAEAGLCYPLQKRRFQIEKDGAGIFFPMDPES